MFFAVDWVNRVDFDALRKGRVKRLQEEMKRRELDALLLFRVENIRYATNYRPIWWPITDITRNYALVPQKGEPVIYMMSGELGRCKKTMSWLPDENVRPLPVMEDPGIVENFVRSEMAPTLFERAGGQSITVGIDALTMVILEELKKAAPDCRLVDGDECVKEAKSIKIPEEIELLRWSSRMAEVGMEAAIRAIGTGVRECEVIGSGMKAMYDLGMEIPQCSDVVTSGEYTSPLHRFASDKPIRRGDLVFMDLGGCLNGYFSDFCRTVIYGAQPSDMQKRIYTAVYEEMQSVLENLKPGKTNEEVNRAARAFAKKHGLEKYGYYGVLGHSIGVSGLEAPLIGDAAAKGEKVFELKPGMVFSCEPTIVVPGVPGGGGVRLENTIVVTEDGNELLTTTPYCSKLLGGSSCGLCPWC